MLNNKNIAIALDFDGVCKVTTQHKHYIMLSLLFTHLYELQRVSFTRLIEAYNHINFVSTEFAGKDRFICVNGLSDYLAGEGWPCRFDGINKAIQEIIKNNEKINRESLYKFIFYDDVKRLLAWSDEVNSKLKSLKEIKITDGLRENILELYADVADFYIVSTAPEECIKDSLEKESFPEIKKYFGQSTATKSEALSSLCHAGYDYIFMFGDSVEDSRACQLAKKSYSGDCLLIFVPVIPGQEEKCFITGRQIIKEVFDNNSETAIGLSESLIKEFDGKEAGRCLNR